MSRRLIIALLVPWLVGWLAGCSDFHRQERPPWRAEADAVCLARGLVTESSVVRASHAIDGPGICGATHPFKVSALATGSVVLNSTQTLDCPMIAALDHWVQEVVQPAAQARFGEPVVRINTMGSYACRGINNMSGASLSEHAFANAIDIGGFVLASGRELNIMKGFNGADEQERAFLHEAHAGACPYFTTVLGPGYNIFHYNHFHVDLAMHGSTSRGPRRYCKPVPQTNLPEPPVKDNLPDPPAIEEELDIARAPVPEPNFTVGAATLLASVPLAPRMNAAPPHPSQTVPSHDMAAFAAVPRNAEPGRTTRGPQALSSGTPLISFGSPVDDPVRPEIAKRTMVPASPAAPRPRSLVDAPRQIGAPPKAVAEDPSESPEPDPRRSQPVEGTPEDWDITSSVRR